MDKSARYEEMMKYQAQKEESRREALRKREEAAFADLASQEMDLPDRLPSGRWCG